MHAPLPTAIHIEVSRACNVQCCCCGYHAAPDGPLMPWETFARILPIIPYEGRVALFGRGEALLHPRFADMVQAVVERGGVPVVHTNGTLLTPELSAKLRRVGMKDMIVSIFSADRDLHETLQVGVDSDEVWGNAAACAAAGIRTQVATCVLLQNREVLGEIAERAARIGVAQIMWLQAYTEPRFDAWTPEMKKRTWELVRAAGTRAQQLGVAVGEYISSR